MDKVQKIREEVERLKNKDFSGTYDARYALDLVATFINSLPEEPEFTIDKDVSQMADEFAEREYELDGYERKWLSKGYYHGYMDANKSKPEEPVSDELEEAAEKYAYETCPSIGVANTETELAFKAGAKWQHKQLEKNRLAACDKQTEEEAEIERDFVMGIIEKEHRQPAFDDAIKYGMRLQKEKMMANAVDGGCFSYKNGFVHISCDVDEHITDVKFGDKVKVIVIKED